VFYFGDNGPPPANNTIDITIGTNKADGLTYDSENRIRSVHAFVYKRRGNYHTTHLALRHTTDAIISIVKGYYANTVTIGDITPIGEVYLEGMGIEFQFKTSTDYPCSEDEDEGDWDTITLDDLTIIRTDEDEDEEDEVDL
jgi:hypothetical protein